MSEFILIGSAPARKNPVGRPAVLDREGAIGKTFGRWTVIGIEDGKYRKRFRCRCSCGAEGMVDVGAIINGRSLSCGCLRRERSSKARPYKNTPEHQSWRGMRERCGCPTNAHYDRYGGRGIRVCDRWQHSFDNFFADMGEKPTPQHSIERIDNDGNYEPSNCRWATAQEQARNTRRTVNLLIDGEMICQSELSIRSGIPVATLSMRRKAGAVGDAVLRPQERPRGEAHGRSKLTADQVREIRNSKSTTAAMARSFGVSTTAIRLILQRRNWKALV